MKKLIIFLFSFIVATTSANAYQAQAGTRTQRLERGTKIELKMSEPVTTKDFSAGDIFSATVTQDVKLGKTIVLPSGTLVRGSIKEINPAKRLSRSAKLALTFDHIVTPQGRQLPIRATLCSKLKLTTDGKITSGGNYGTATTANLEQTGKYIKQSTNWGVESSKKLFPGAFIITVPVGAVGGTLFGTGYLLYESVADLIRKGDEVIINQGQLFDIILLDYLDVPVN